VEEREENQQDKTEEATEEKRRQFREEGQIASPKEIIAAVALIAVTIGLFMIGEQFTGALKISFQRTFAAIAERSRDSVAIMDIVSQILAPIVPLITAAVIVLTALPSIIGLALTRFNWSWKKITPTADKLNFVSGLQRMVSTGGLEEFAKVVIKGVTLSTVLFIFLKREIDSSSLAYFQDLKSYSFNLFSSIMKLMIWTSVTVGILAVADYGYSLFRLERQMMMSKQEIKDENKAQEGDPLVKGQRRRMARELIMRKNIAAVPTATFIVTNPTHFSVAVRYVRGMSSPVVVAKGQDFLALKIREIAKKNDIMLVENKALARTLYKTVKVGQEVPPSLYASVIEVMKFIYQARGRDYFERYNLQGAVG
jgi:flagellar biosynthetic protein FlhB